MNEKRWFAVGVTVAYAVVALVGIMQHEPWRDELQAWMVVTDADSLSGVYRNMRYEGNPMLWQLFLFGLSRFTVDPRIMQIFHWTIAVAFVWVWTRHAPFSRLQRLLFPFGYFALFEYGLISQNYAFGVLLLGIVCALYPRRRERYLWIGVVLFLLANTSLYGMIIAGGFAAMLVLEFLEKKRTGMYAGRGRALGAGMALAVAGIGLSALQIWPEPDNTFFVPWPGSYKEPRWSAGTSQRCWRRPEKETWSTSTRPIIRSPPRPPLPAMTATVLVSTTRRRYGILFLPWTARVCWSCCPTPTPSSSGSSTMGTRSNVLLPNRHKT